MIWNQQATDRICGRQLIHPARQIISGLKSYMMDNDPGMLAYLSYMADRLWLCHGMLKETGSIYLHCAAAANYYLRLLMDAIFGAENSQNEITWKRAASPQKYPIKAPK